MHNPGEVHFSSAPDAAEPIIYHANASRKHAWHQKSMTEADPDRIGLTHVSTVKLTRERTALIAEPAQLQTVSSLLNLHRDSWT